MGFLLLFILSRGVLCGNAVEILDSSFFTPKKDEKSEKARTSKGAMTNTERYFNSEEPETNEEQRRGWIESCTSQKSDPKAYSDCYKREKTNSIRRNAKQVEEIERKQAQPLRNSSPIPFAEEINRIPSDNFESNDD